MEIEEILEMATLDPDQFMIEFETLMKNRGVRELVWLVLTMSGMHTMARDLSGQELAFKEGQRSVGHKLLGLLSAMDSEWYMVMYRENLHRQKHLENKREAKDVGREEFGYGDEPRGESVE